MASIFTRIINGEIPCFKVQETKDYIAFFDVAPIAKGHTLVVPKDEKPIYLIMNPNIMRVYGSLRKKLQSSKTQSPA